MRTGVDVDRIGYIRHPSIPRSGASPDSLVGDDGVLEIKCPKTTTHLTYFKAGVVPEEYVPQCVWELACSGRKWLDFVSYDFRLHEDFNLLIVRMERDDEQIAAMEEEVRTFRAELNALAETFLKGRDASAMRPQAVPVGPGVEKAQALPDDDWIGTAKEA
jgi:hypothetical protein